MLFISIEYAYSMRYIMTEPPISSPNLTPPNDKVHIGAKACSLDNLCIRCIQSAITAVRHLTEPLRLGRVRPLTIKYKAEHVYHNDKSLIQVASPSLFTRIGTVVSFSYYISPWPQRTMLKSQCFTVARADTKGRRVFEFDFYCRIS